MRREKKEMARKWSQKREKETKINMGREDEGRKGRKIRNMPGQKKCFYKKKQIYSQQKTKHKYSQTKLGFTMFQQKIWIFSFVLRKVQRC